MDTLFLSSNSCLEFVENFNSNRHPYETLSLLVPTNNTVWTERNATWYSLFSVMIALLFFLYLTVGIVSVILLVRRDCVRLGTRTFFAVYLSMAILGLSRAAFFVLDPFGVLGYISDPFPAWIILSRFMAAVGFPSLVAACTLIILTLIKLANAKPGKQWYECWTYVLPLLVLPYAPALVAEALGHINTYSAIFSGIACETFFVFWGLSICILFLLAGTRLLNALKISHRKVTIVSMSEGHSINQQPSNLSAYQYRIHNRKTKKIARKIIIITFGTATIGVLYSLASAGSVIIVLLVTLKDCMGFNKQTSSAAWLVVQFLNFLTEILFAGLILYSMTDISLLLCFIKRLLLCCITGTKNEETSLSSTPDMGAEEGGRIEEDGDMQEDGDMVEDPTEADDQLENRFTIKTNNNSDSSIESVETQEEEQNFLNPGRKVSQQHPGRKVSQPGRKVSQQHDSIMDDGKPESGIRPIKLPLDLNTVSNVLSIPDSPPHTHPYVLWPPKQKLKRTQGSDPTLARSNRDTSLGDQLVLRHCKTHKPIKHHHHRQLSSEAVPKMSSLVSIQSSGSLALKPHLPPKPFTRQSTT